MTAAGLLGLRVADPDDRVARLERYRGAAAAVRWTAALAPDDGRGTLLAVAVGVRPSAHTRAIERAHAGTDGGLDVRSQWGSVFDGFNPQDAWIGVDLQFPALEASLCLGFNALADLPFLRAAVGCPIGWSTAPRPSFDVIARSVSASVGASAEDRHIEQLLELVTVRAAAGGPRGRRPLQLVRPRSPRRRDHRRRRRFAS